MRVFLLTFTILIASQGAGRAQERLSDEEVRESAARIDAALLEVIKEQRWKEDPATAIPPIASDEVFLRRLMVDLVGRLPSVMEVREFEQGMDATKRERWIRRVAASEEAERWRYRRIADALRVKDEVNRTSMRPYIDWLKGEVKKDAPYDGIVRQMLEAQGSVEEDPAVGFLLSDGKELKVAAGETMRALLGVDIQCAACHDEPYGDTSQREFLAFAGAFNRVVADEQGGLKLAAEPTPLRLPAGYQYRDGHPGEVVPIAKLPMPELGPKMGVNGLEWPQEAVRTAVSEWVTGEDNLRFQDVAALRVWGWMFGRVAGSGTETMGQFSMEAPEEMLTRLHDCAALGPGEGSLVGLKWERGRPQPLLLAVLREEWGRCGGRLGEFQKVLAHTEAYQREAVAGDKLGYSKFLPAPTVRRLPAEVIYSALKELAGEKDKTVLPEVLPVDHPLRQLGRGGRVWADSDVAPVSHALARFLMNGELTKAVSELPAGFRDRGVEEWFLAILGRAPSTRELRLAKSHLEINPESGMSDVVWALINTSEFVFQR